MDQCKHGWMQDTCFEPGSTGKRIQRIEQCVVISISIVIEDIDASLNTPETRDGFTRISQLLND